MTIELEITDEQVSTRTFNAKDGKPLSFREQRAWLHSGDTYPVPFTISLGDRSGFAPGRYRLGARAYRVNRYGNLELSRDLDLVRLD